MPTVDRPRPRAAGSWHYRRSLRDPNLDSRVDILESEYPRRPELSGQTLRLVELEDDIETCALAHPDARERSRVASALLGTPHLGGW